MEVRAVGPVLTVLMDGLLLAKIEDSALPTGLPRVEASAGMILEQLEYIDLGGKRL